MADQHLIRKILADSHTRGFLGQPPGSISLSNITNNANMILSALKKASVRGLDSDNLSQILGLSKPTINIYLNCLVRLGYISVEINLSNKSKKIWFFK